MGTFLRTASRPWLLAFGCLILTPVVLGVESSDYLESLKDDEEPLGPKEAVTEYPNGVNVIPGEADIHYPIYAKIPKSSFNCFGRRPGFYANTDLRCQVWHICDESGVQQDFLCTNGTIYSQDKRVCDWWYNVNCDPEEVSRNYEQNEELYKGPPPKKNTERHEEESNDLPPPPPRKSAPAPPPQQRRPQQQPSRQQEFQRNEPQQQQRQEVQPTARRIGSDERPYTVEDRNPESVQSRPPPPSRPAGSPPPSGTPEKKRVIVLRLPGPLPPGATIPPHILMEYAESVLAAERSGKAPPTGLHDLRNSQNSNRHQPSQQQRPRPPPTTTTQAPPPPPPPPPQQPLGPRVSKPFTPVLPYTPRPFSTFLEAASKFNGQTKTKPTDNGEQNYNRPAQTPPPTQRPTQPPTPPTQRTTQQQQNYNRVQEQNNFRSSQAPQRPTADPQNYEREQQRAEQQQNNQRPQEQPQRPVQEQQNFKQSQAPPQSPQTSTDCDPESGQYCGEAVYERQREERLQQQQKQRQQSQRPQERPQQRPQEEPRQPPPRPQERPQQRPQEETRQQAPRPQERPQQRPQEDQRQQQRQNEEPRQQSQRPQERPQQHPQEDSRQQQQQQRQQHEEQRQQSQRPQERPQQRPQEEPRQQQQQRQQYEEPRQQSQRPQERPQQRPQEEPRDQQSNYERREEQEYQQRPQQQQSRPTSRPTPPPLDDAPLPEKKVPAKSPSSKSHAAPESSQKKFRHSTPRKIANVKFAPKSQALLEEEDGGFVVEESRRPAYPFQFNAYQQQPSVPEPQQQTSSVEKESVHLKSVVNPFQEKPRRQKHRPQQQPEYTPEVAPTRAPEEATTVRRLVVVAKTLKIKDPRQQEARPVAPEVPFTEDFPREAYEAVKIGSNYRGTTEAPTTFRTVARPTTTTTHRPSPPSTTTTTTTTEATTPEQVETQFSTVQPVRRIIKKKKLRPITTTTTEHYDGQYVPNEPEHFFPSTESSAFSKITEDLGLDIYGRSPDDDEEEELIRAAQLYLQASESYGKRKRL